MYETWEKFTCICAFQFNDGVFNTYCSCQVLSGTFFEFYFSKQMQFFQKKALSEIECTFLWTTKTTWKTGLNIFRANHSRGFYVMAALTFVLSFRISTASNNFNFSHSFSYYKNLINTMSLSIIKLLFIVVLFFGKFCGGMIKPRFL